MVTDSMEAVADVDMDSSSSSSDESNSEDEKLELDIKELRHQLSQNPMLYSVHIDLLKALRKAGELELLREARQNFSSFYPLTAELWLNWIKDEIKFCGEEVDRDKITKLFDSAVEDYLSVDLWLEYCQFSIGGMGAEGGVQRVRDTFERALTACGLHVSQGALIWEAYREFELAVLSGLQASPEDETDREKNIKAQTKKITNLFTRQVSIPLYDMEDTWTEFVDFVNCCAENATQVKQRYEAAKKKLDNIEQYEHDLLTGEGDTLAVYTDYLNYERKAGDPARVRALYERALVDHCLQPDLWRQYLTYLERDLKSVSEACRCYQRALRNVPWSAHIWSGYLRLLERDQREFCEVKEAFDKGLNAGMTDGSDFLILWTTFVDYLRRRIQWEEEDHKKELDDFRNFIEQGIDHLGHFKEQGDPECILLKYWAFIEAEHCNDCVRGRELWNTVMQLGHGNRADSWLEFFRFERSFGDAKNVRRALQRAVNSVTDYPEAVFSAYIEYERQRGTLESYETAVQKIEVQRERLAQRQKQIDEKEAKIKAEKQKEQQQRKQEKKEAKAREAAEAKGMKGKWSNFQPPVAVKRKAPLKPSTGEEFKVPSLPEAKAPSAKRLKTEDKATALQNHGEFVEHDSSKDNFTAFVSNLAFSTDENAIRNELSKCGDIANIRIVRDYKGRSKGFAYVEFNSTHAVDEALKRDRVLVDNRPMFVSRCQTKLKGEKAAFKYSTSMEETKLFVKNLPFTITEEALKNMFSPHGALRSVRLVTHKTGRPKGLAYIEFEDKESASRAVLKTDGVQVGDHQISVAISNPPARGQPAKERTAQTHSLGAGKTTTLGRGKAHTQILLTPRALQQKTRQPSTEQSGSAVPKSNDEFREMLLSKK